MAFKGGVENKGAFTTPGERLYVNKAGDMLVPAGHKDAAVLFCTEVGQVKKADLEKYKRYRPPGRPKGSKTKAKAKPETTKKAGLDE